MHHDLAAQFDRIDRLVGRARYNQAFDLARRIYLAHRQDPYARYRYAVMLGDNQEGISLRRAEHNRVACLKILRPLLRRLRLFDLPTRSRIRNEYYWFSKQPRKQYLLGVQTVRRGVWKGWYSQGVGAAWHALALAKSGQSRRAARWSAISVAACRRYLARRRYYNVYVHMALALGVGGRFAEMEIALNTGARRAGRQPAYAEFEEIRKIIRGLRRPPRQRL